MIVCTFDDRPSDIIGLKLLIASLQRHMPGLDIYVACPVADDDFRGWLKAFPRVTLDDAREWQGMGWDVKPHLLMKMLDAGHPAAVWIDSDIIVTRDFGDYLDDESSLVITEEHAIGRNAVRQRVHGWGLDPGREITGINTCFVCVRQIHRSLLASWIELMSSATYQHARTLPIAMREPHLLGDQDVLAGLLASTGFSDVRMRVLRRGSHIIQHIGSDGYPPSERLRHLFSGMPPLIHSQGYKPWRYPEVPSIWRDTRMFFIHLYLELSPYSHFARQYTETIPNLPASLTIRTPIGRFSNAISLGKPSLRGLGQSMVATTAATIRAGIRKGTSAFRKVVGLMFRRMR